MRYPRTISGSILAAGLLAGSFALANTTPQRPGPQSDSTAAGTTWRIGAVKSLSALQDADALITAGALAQNLSGDAGKSLSLLDRATVIAPQAADIGLLDVIQCGTHPGCDALKREARVRSIDPHNGDVWMAELHDASTHADLARIDEALSNMARSTHFNFYFASLGRRFIAGLNRVPTLPDDPADRAGTPEARRQEQAMSMVAALAMPALQDLMHACQPGSTAGDARHKTCRDIATSMEHGDTMIANLVGLRLHEWTARDAGDRAEAVAQRRRLQWRMNQLSAIAGTPALPPTKEIATMLAHEREVDSIDAMLTDAGRPLDPPTGWQPPQPQGARPPSSP
ncbi:hypothetical protein [Rhodanobacter sp. C05]|uniref:hypothetical protein n=1 Tax=Rhodanobacter sp. C05 TaxID=1945855 RepID=UPI000987A69B|nr:hypothetical protein [Rhodanobacter sp. C05]OOG37076.1 hypothetical protein B0E51_17385 [Rhodanobacter sp. C05]